MKEKEEEKFSWVDLGKAVLYLVGKERKKYILLTITLLFLFTYEVVPPFIIGLIVDFFTNWQQGESLSLFYSYIFILGVSFALVGYMRLSVKRALSSLKVKVEYDIKVRGFKKLINQQYLQYKEEPTGVKMQKIQNGVLAFRSLLSLMNNQIFYTVILFVGTLVVFLFLNPFYALLFCAYAIMFFSIIGYFYKKIQRLSYKRDIAREKSSGSYVEGLNNVLTIKASGAEKSFQKNIVGREEVVKKHSLEGVILVNNQWKTFQIFNGVFMAIFLLFIGKDVINQVITVGSIVTYFTYLQRLTSSASKILSTYQELIEIKVSISRMMPIFLKKTNKKSGINFPKTWDKLKFIKANFKYSQDAKGTALKGIKDLNLKIEKNSKVGFAGKTGSGKSTLAKLLVGLYKLDSGEYLVGDSNFYTIKDEEIRNNISIVLQESEMFNFSLRENITLMQKFNEKLFKKAITISQLEEVIAKLPQGLDTIIGEKGYHLSGGERQRVGIARAIYQNTQIMIFDEATSSLDNNTEALIQRSIEKRLKNKTLIFIAHRITTLENVDRIYVFKNGKLVEDGKYQTLINNPKSEFYKLSKK